MAAIVIAGDRGDRVEGPVKRRRADGLVVAIRQRRRTNSEISAPAAKRRSPPVTTTAPGGSALQVDGGRLELGAAAPSTAR